MSNLVMISLISLLLIWSMEDSLSEAVVNSTSLACYDCSEAFKYVWDPYTECQAFPTDAPLRECLSTEHYCKVERTTYREMTVSITRSCTEKCWYGCHATGFGHTKLSCTTCCQGRGCNTGNWAVDQRVDSHCVCLIAMVFSFLSLISNA